MLIDVICGARPNFVKVAAIIRALEFRKKIGGKLEYRLVHTGQHYDVRMSGDFFKQLSIPEPDVNLGVGSGTQAEQTGAIMIRYERLLSEARSDLCLVVGDVTSSMACAIVAQKLCIAVAHVEAGIRSSDWTMPEEINRIVTDSISNICFTTSNIANQNLIRMGVSEGNIHFVGNTMIDTLLINLPRLRKPVFFDRHNLRMGEYFVTTLHRPANVDNKDNFVKMLHAISDSTGGRPVVFPVHPRTAKTLSELSDIPACFHMTDPLPYLEFNFLVKNAKAVITDSGGITEETTVMGVPCLTLRDNTERPETVTEGTNELIGTDLEKLKPAFDRLLAGRWKKGKVPEKWDGKAGDRIVAVLEHVLFT